MLVIDPLDLFAAAWLFVCWTAYALLARWRAGRSFCIASALHYHRQRWMAAMLSRNNRIGDASLLANLERNATFLASTAILIIAGLVTAQASIEKLHSMLSAVPFLRSNLSPFALQLKIGLMLLIYIYAFFSFTWAVRQYGFCAVLLGAAPAPDQKEAQGEQGRSFAKYTAKVIDRAGHSYNNGLRAYYFSLSILVWMLNTWVFLLAVVGVVAVLYGREFHSKTLRALILASNLNLEDIQTDAGSTVPVRNKNEDW